MRTGVAEGVLEAAARLSIESASTEELADTIQELEHTRDQLAFESTRLGAEFDRRAGYQKFGFVDFVSWFKFVCRATGGAAAERLKVARRLAALPSTARAWEQGKIGLATAAVIVRAAADVGTESAATLERDVLAKAPVMDPGTLQRHAERVSCELNQVAFQNKQTEAHAHRRLDVGIRPDGMISVEGMLDQEGGATVMKALDVMLGPAAAHDKRTPAQRRADAWVEIARNQLSGSAKTSNGVRPVNTTMTASLESVMTITNLPAKLEQIFSVSREAVRRQLCDSAITPVVVDGNDNPLHLGRTVRSVPASTRRAVMVKHATCAWPSCTRPVDWSAMHHLKHWLDGGETDIENVIPVCNHHHWMVHEAGWRIERSPTGEVSAIPPDS